MKHFSLKRSMEEHTWIYVAVYVASFLPGFLLGYGISAVFSQTPLFGLIAATVAGLLSLLIMRESLRGEQSALQDGDKRGIIWCAASGLLAFVAMLLVYLSLEVYPFGENSILIVDMHHQYVAFFSSLRDKLTSGQSLLYSSYVGLGSNYIPLLSYYVCSPLNLITLLFPRENLTESLVLITMLKMSIAAVCFSIFARGVFKKTGVGISVLSVAYALMSYMITYSWDIMWLDTIMVLPLVVYGLDSFLKGKKPFLYVLSLAYALMTNYYIGYMVCVYLVFYFVVHVITNSRGYTLLRQLKRAGRFAYGSLLAGGLSAIILLPTYIGLMLTSGADDVFARDLSSYFKLFEIFGRLMFSADPSIRGDSLPNVYCSVLAVFLVLLFAMCRRIRLKTRLAWCGLLCLMILCASVNWTYFAFHGFHFPNDLPHRFSFLISFTVLAMAVQVLARLRFVTRRNVLVALCIAAGALIVTESLGNEQTDFTLIYVSLMFFVLYGAIILLSSAKLLRQNVTLTLLLCVVFIEVTANACVLIHRMDANEYFTAREDFVVDYEVNTAALEKVESYNTPQYRTELLPRKTCNDPSLFGYSGLTVFASSNDQSVITLMGSLGYANNGVNSHMYKSFIPFVDSVLDLRYVIFQNSLGKHPQLSLLDSVSDESGQERFIYQNEYALSRAFVVNDSIREDWDYTSNNPFEVQNSLVTSATEAEPIYSMVTPSDAETIGCDVEFDDWYFICTKEDSAPSCTFTAVTTMPETHQSYIYVDCRAATSIGVEAGESSWSSSTNEPFIIDMATLEAGEQVRVTITTNMTCVGNIFIASMDLAAFEAAIEALGSSQLTISSYSQTHIAGTVNAEQDGVMFTSIPFDKGWSVRVDNKEVETYPLGDALLGFDVGKGMHQVDLSYSTPGLAAGAVITVICALVLVLLGVLLSPRLGLGDKLKAMLTPVAASTEDPELFRYL